MPETNQRTVSSLVPRQAVIPTASSPPSPASPAPGTGAGGSGLGRSAGADGAGRRWRSACVPDDAPDWCYGPPPEEPNYDPGAVLDRIIAEAGAGQITIPPGPGGEIRLREPSDSADAELLRRHRGALHAVVNLLERDLPGVVRRAVVRLLVDAER
jgi:hypothetical protein